MTTGSGLRIAAEHRAESTVAVVTGRLTPAGYPELRDGVLRIAADAPESVVVDIEGLEIADVTLMTVFSVIADRIVDWPAIPFAVVTARADHAAGFAAQNAGWSVPVCRDVVAAEAARERAPSRRAVQLLAPSSSASADARAFVRRVCATWGVLQYTDDALMVATELVENALAHTESSPRLRLELRRGRFTVAVADDDPRPAVLRERITRAEPGLGLWVVVWAARRWGCARSWSGGKVVWAVLVRRDR